ncbi:MAG TPA: hypothetical protein VHN14_03755, partial [Kofleriaceae bacterium]|nr:hypothetical protein [Kofleriaceae bacterium]
MTSRWLWAGALALAACTDSRQIVLSIDTTAGIPCDIDRIRVVARAAGTTTFEQSLKGERLPVTVTLLDDTPNGSFQLDISALKGDVEVMRTSGSLRFSGNKAVEPVLLAPTCTPDAPCALSDAMADGAAAPAPSRGACVARYNAGMALDSFSDACKVPGFGTVLTDGSTRPARLMALESALLGSGFQFYGRPIHHIWVTKDGYLSFTQGSPDSNGAILPGAFDRDIKHIGAPPPPQSVMAFWTPLSLSPMGVCYALDGAPTHQQLRVTWPHVCLTDVCATDDLNFTITLEEDSQQIMLTYGTMTAGNADGARGINATVGLVNDATGCPVEECSLATGLCKDGVTPCGYSQVFSNTLQTPKV